MRRSDSEAIEAAIEEDPEEAVRLCEALLEEVEDDADIWAYLAESELAAGRGDDALEALAQVVELDPEWIEAFTLRAEILIDQGKLGAAAIELDVAIELDADDARVLRARALMLEVGGDGADDFVEQHGLFFGSVRRVGEEHVRDLAQQFTALFARAFFGEVEQEREIVGAGRHVEVSLGGETLTARG